MANIPIPLDVHDLVSDEDQTYRIHLLTAIPVDDVWVNSGAIVEPSEGNYASIETYPNIDEDEEGYAHATLDPVLFKGDDWAGQHSIVGFAISAVFDNGNIPVAWVSFANPAVLGAGTDDLNILATLEAFDIPPVIETNIVYQ